MIFSGLLCLERNNPPPFQQGNGEPWKGSKSFTCLLRKRVSEQHFVSLALRIRVRSAIGFPAYRRTTDKQLFSAHRFTLACWWLTLPHHPLQVRQKPCKQWSLYLRCETIHGDICSDCQRRPGHCGQVLRAGPAQGMDVPDSHLLLLLLASHEHGASCSQHTDYSKTNYK